MGCQHAVHQQHIVALLLRLGDIGVLLLGVVGIEVDDVLVLVGLQGLDFIAVVVQTEELSLGVFQQSELQCTFTELLVGQHAVLHKNLDVVPLVLKVLAVVLEHLFQLVGHLLAYMTRNLLHVAVALQVAAAHVQGDIGAVEHAVQQHQVVGHHALHAVGHEHLVAVQLNLVARRVDGLAHLGEIENTRQVEGVVHIEVNLEQGILEIHRVQLVVELLIVFVCQIGRALLPGRLCVVDDAGLLLLHALGLLLLRLFGIIGIFRLVGLFRRLVHPHALFAKADGDGHKAAVFSQQLEYGLLVEELLAVVGDVQHNAGAALGVLLVLRHGELGVALAAPVDGGFVLVRLGENLHLVGHHKGRIETQSEVTYQIFLYVFVFVEEVGGTAEGYLVDILLHLVGGHADAAVFHREGLLLAVHLHLYGQVAGLALQLAARGKGFQFLGCVDGVGYQLAQKDFVVGIKELLNDRKDVLGLYIQIALHDISFFCFSQICHHPRAGAFKAFVQLLCQIYLLTNCHLRCEIVPAVATL